MNSYERVKLSRERTAGSFPFPALRPSLDYAICEFAGELRDAVLRDERGGDVRNTDKAHSQRAEPTQRGRLLVTNAKKVTVSVLYWYEKLSGNIVSKQFLKPFTGPNKTRKAIYRLAQLMPRSVWPAQPRHAPKSSHAALERRARHRQATRCACFGERKRIGSIRK